MFPSPMSMLSITSLPLFNPLQESTSLQMIPSLPNTVLNRYLNFWRKGEAEVQKYFQQFNDRRYFEPNNPRNLTFELIRKSLAYLMFLKLNNDGVVIKGRGCTDERKQRNWISKEDTSLPTVST